METHDSVDSMTGAYAEQAVIIAREFNARLDYSENSLMELEGILSQLALDRQQAFSVDENSPPSYRGRS
jgi:hypothetical protein